MLKINSSFRFISFSFILIFILAGCSTQKNLPTKGNLTAYVDESVYPLMLSERNAFEQYFREANIDIIPVNADEGIKMFINNKTNFFVSSRSFNSDESQNINTKNKNARTYTFCYGGIAVITSPKSYIRSITYDDLQNLLLGKDKSKEIFIPPKNSGVYVFLKRDFLNDEEPANSKIAESEKEVITEVKAIPNTIGLVGFNIIDDISAIKILPLGMEDHTNKKVQYYSPGSLTFNTYYPLSREIYIFLNDEQKGLTSGFATYLLSKDGEEIVKKNNLSPGNYPVEIVKLK
jgi:ABC-type phosphate transport system substrate-binding protein